MKQAAYGSAKFISQRDDTRLEELDSAESEVAAAEIYLRKRELDETRLTVRVSVTGVR